MFALVLFHDLFFCLFKPLVCCFYNYNNVSKLMEVVGKCLIGWFFSATASVAGLLCTLHALLKLELQISCPFPPQKVPCAGLPGEPSSLQLISVIFWNPNFYGAFVLSLYVCCAHYHFGFLFVGGNKRRHQLRKKIVTEKKALEVAIKDFNSMVGEGEKLPSPNEILAVDNFPWPWECKYFLWNALITNCLMCTSWCTYGIWYFKKS